MEVVPSGAEGFGRRGVKGNIQERFRCLSLVSLMGSSFYSFLVYIGAGLVFGGGYITFRDPLDSILALLRHTGPLHHRLIQAIRLGLFAAGITALILEPHRLPLRPDQTLCCFGSDIRDTEFLADYGESQSTDFSHLFADNVTD